MGCVMKEPGLFDLQNRLDQLRQFPQPLRALNDHVDWELFRPQLEALRQKERKSNAGRKPYDAVLMFKVLVLQSLYNLSDAQTQFQIPDRLSFMEFLGLSLQDGVPDEKTVWLFREQLKTAELIEPLFEKFEDALEQAGFAARKGQIIDASTIDASIVAAPRQHHSREENQQIKAGQTPAQWEEQPNKKRQKDTDARWTKKNG